MMAFWLLLRPFAHWIVGALGIVTLIGGFAWQQQNVGARKVIERSAAEGKKIHERAKAKAKSAAANPQLPCRDCK